ncbi:anti-sigma regulatory factor (Ser/Thr protein kinase) [Streptomyces sp. AK010]|nr:anti-sigma regulatory factor (Ser/Thr protein kinase) [Streptomyces sp. AK010]
MAMISIVGPTPVRPARRAAGRCRRRRRHGSRPCRAAFAVGTAHALDPHHVADRDVEPDTAQVPRARKLAVDQVDAWGLEEAAFVTELVVSELVTNAIRYGAPPIRLRLIRDTSLICEVFDAGNTAPHLRRAGAFDEGGRGLLLVAQLTHGWGTRHTTDGKTIWCAQSLPRPEPH